MFKSISFSFMLCLNFSPCQGFVWTSIPTGAVHVAAKLFVNSGALELEEGGLDKHTDLAGKKQDVMTALAAAPATSDFLQRIADVKAVACLRGTYFLGLLADMMQQNMNPILMKGITAQQIMDAVAKLSNNPAVQKVEIGIAAGEVSKTAWEAAWTHMLAAAATTTPIVVSDVLDSVGCRDALTLRPVKAELVDASVTVAADAADMKIEGNDCELSVEDIYSYVAPDELDESNHSLRRDVDVSKIANTLNVRNISILQRHIEMEIALHALHDP